MSPHARELPERVRAAAQAELDPDRRIITMLGARGERTLERTEAVSDLGPDGRGKTVAKPRRPE